MTPHWIPFDIKGDGRGQLIALESNRNIPFTVNRFYYMYGVPASTPRGFHAHRALEQVAICLSGSCRMILDDGASREEYVLDTPDKGLYIGNMIWREMHDFSPDAVLAVLASAFYDEADYIRDYDSFLAAAQPQA